MALGAGSFPGPPQAGPRGPEGRGRMARAGQVHPQDADDESSGGPQETGPMTMGCPGSENKPQGTDTHGGWEGTEASPQPGCHHAPGDLSKTRSLSREYSRSLDTPARQARAASGNAQERPSTNCHSEAPFTPE